MVVPEFRCPTTPATFTSTSFCATVVPTLGSDWSSRDIRSKVASRPPIFIFAAFASSTASRAPFSLSLPRCAIPPVSGATLPMVTPTVLFAGAAWAWGFLSSPQPARPSSTEAAIVAPKRKRIIATSRKSGTPSAAELLQRQDVLREDLGLVVADGSVRRHRDGAPHAGRAAADLLHDVVLGVRARLVLGGDVLVRGADQLVVDGVAAEAGLVLQQLRSVRGEGSTAAQRDGNGGGQGEGLHGFSGEWKFGAMLLDFLVLENEVGQGFQAVDRGEAGGAFAHPRADP